MTKIIDCPKCEGAGGFENMTGLSYSGNQSWRIMRCEHCDGRGKIEVDDEEEEESENSD
jgi:DnaJ-class molecular chaperone